MSSEPRHVVILGPMGVGKTTVGGLVAETLGWDLVDSDHVIEALHGQSGRDIAAESGVEQLHRIEAEVFIEALGFAPPSVIAPAASVADRPELLDRLDMPSVLAAVLTCDIDVLIARVSSGAHRRIIDEATMRTMVARRTDALEPHAHTRIDVTTATPQAAAKQVIALIRGNG